MKLIKDLGTKKTNGVWRHFGLYMCSGCMKEIVRRVDGITSNTLCISCQTTKQHTTHGDSRKRLYHVWESMKGRIKNKNCKQYNDYGGRGISLCEKWNKYENFRSWALLNGYSDNLTIDRIDNDGNYEPSNCRFVSRTIQQRNTRKIRKNNKSGYRGVRATGKRWSSRIGINKKEVYLGVFDYPWTAALAYDSYVINNNLEHTRNYAS